MASITLEELHAYHTVDREIFSRLVVTLRRDPAESLLVVALWLWLEEKGFPNIIAKLVNQPDTLMEALAGEAVSCLQYLRTNSPSVPSTGVLPLTARIMQKDITLQILFQNKLSTLGEIKNFLDNVCCRVFTDILQLVTGSSSRQQVMPNQPLIISNFPHRLFGSVTIVPRAIDYGFPIGCLWGWQLTLPAPEDDRTLFLTFSRGFPVSEAEVRELFSKICGDHTVHSVRMQENVSVAEQPLFARLIMHSVRYIDRILGGRRIAKFRINGKHIWARKYTRRE